MLLVNVSQLFAVLLFGQCYTVYGYHDSSTTVGYAALERDNTDSEVSNGVFIPDALQTFDENAKLISFNYYSDRAGIDIKFQIWRPDGGNRYELIWQSETVTTPDDSGAYTYDVTGDQWADAGDTIGIAMSGRNPLRYTADSSCTLMEYPLDASSASVGQTKTFSEVTSSECRIYSLEVEVVYDNVDATALNCTLLVAEDSYQFLQSSNYDGATEYEEDTHECWIFQADSSGRQIRITFENFNFEDPYVYGGGECANDFLEFHDGEDFWEEINYELCGTDYPAYGINSSGRYLYMRMHSDANGFNGLGFQLLYKSFDDSEDKDKKEDDPVNIATILCIVFAIIALLLIIPIIILWIKTKRTRDAEARDRLKENDFLQLERSRPAAWSPAPPKPKPKTIDIGKHREEFLKSKMQRAVPDAPAYHEPRQPEGSESVKIKHWSKLTAGVRWNPVKKQFRVHDSGAGESNS